MSATLPTDHLSSSRLLPRKKRRELSVPFPNSSPVWSAAKLTSWRYNTPTSLCLRVCPRPGSCCSHAAPPPRSSKVIQMSRRAAEHQAQSTLKELEEEIEELRRRSASLTQLALSEDYLHFLKVLTQVVLPLFFNKLHFNHTAFSGHVCSKTEKNCNYLNWRKCLRYLKYVTMSLLRTVDMLSPQSRPNEGIKTVPFSN